ncbi:ABC-2 type transport system permease protein [Actinomadura luteofluorescens]|uniref:ABC-2 type transport system permease protein n=1 Tax=Actinomadura luteofluorescens TaxID=46163 RepID=A0A7Y9EPU2_9ACTN|nr:ABC transporter permease subunit [Actinomadura luteofluorescens]NYD51692.1 ABC-2 type transport system permease protein [Actinomadura luteofluorescens]
MILRAEWTKLHTVRSTPWLLLAAATSTIGLGAATVALTTGSDLVAASLSGVYCGQIAIVVLAVLAMTNEYASGLVSTTLACTPRRTRVLLAKTATVIATVLSAALASVTGSLVAARSLAGDQGITVTSGPALRAAFGTVLYLTLVALLSLGIATALRHTAAALTTVLGLLYLFPLLAQFIGDERWHTRIERYAPMSAGLAVQSTTNLGDLPIGPWTGLGVLAAYAGAALLLGAVLFTTRDA